MIGVHSIAKSCTNITVQCSFKAFIGTNYGSRSSFWGESDKKVLVSGWECALHQNVFSSTVSNELSNEVGTLWMGGFTKRRLRGFLWRFQCVISLNESQLASEKRMLVMIIEYKSTYIVCSDYNFRKWNDSSTFTEKEWPCRGLTFVKKGKGCQKETSMRMRGSKLMGRLANI